MKLNKLPLNVIGLNRVGLNQIGSPSRRANTSDRPYIDPEVLASLVAVCICDGKSNNDPDRAVIKNLVDPDNPFIISNAAFKLNSGYGKYEVDFTSWSRLIGVKAFSNKFVIENKAFNCAYYVRDTGEDLDEFKAKINNHTDGIIRYTYINQDGIVANLDISPDDSNRVFTFPKSYNSIEGVANHICGFQTPMFVNTGIIIEQIPSHQGAFVTDGKDDLIASTKTVKEMLGGSNEVTVVSMVHQIGLSSLTTINNIRSESVAHVVCRNICSSAGKTGVYGYSRQINTNNPPTLINNILGDKKDYTAEGKSALDPTDKFFVQGYKYSGTISEVSPIAYYWTFIANKVLTTDQINQVISYFNLDKHVKPDVYYDVKKQGLSNDTPEADWYLKDFSGNGHDMQLYNFAKKLGSGISKYEEDFTTWRITKSDIISTITHNSVHVTHVGKQGIKEEGLFENNTKVNRKFNIKLKITGLTSNTRCSLNNEYKLLKELANGVNEISADLVTGWYGFMITSLDGSIIGDCDITIEQIPDYEGALVSDGIDDYGKVENLPIYKDYTVAIDRAWTNDLVKAQCLTSKLNGDNFGSFSFELIENGFSSYSFGISNKGVITIDSNKKISYQSKYVYNGSPIISGNNVDGKDLFLFRNRDSYPYYAEAAIWSYILFPYTLSEFLLERQLKRYKLGTLYPGMIEWRPKVNINVPVVTPPTFSMNNGSDIITNGQYIPEGTEITIRIFTTTDSSVGGINEATAKINGVDIELSPSGNKTYYGGKFIVSSKQKIDITIDEYIRYEDIVQPYPAIINLKQDGKTITWGDKLKVGSDIVFVGSANLLPELYTVSETRYNGVTLYPNTIIKVEKSMVFDNARTYLKANEPNCILSPNRLRIPNSSYKILGYIPDLTGKGNHGRLNNFAYAGMSGANGYVEDFTKWSKNSSLDDVEITYDRIKVNKLTRSTVLYVTSNKFINKIKIVASGIPNGGKLTFTQYPDNAIENNKEFEIGGVTTTGSWGFSIKEGLNLDWSNLVIQQIGEHEGSICFDGTDDHITISNVIGGKCIMAKVTVNRNSGIIYDQRRANVPNKSWMQLNPSSVIFEQNAVSTYIDGILNHNVTGSDLVSKTVNLTCELEIGDTSGTYQPTIGSSYAVGYTTNINLYEFMLFPDVPNEEEIKELNEVMGIENNIEVS